MTPVIDRPQPMWGKTKLVRGGAFVPGRIYWDDSIPERPRVLLAEINGREVPAEQAWIALLGHPITEEEYNLMVAVRDHCERYEPQAPEVNAGRKIDLSAAPAMGPRRST